jgi:DNA-binding winged helix-turn-helix (wHTH) protein
MHLSNSVMENPALSNLLPYLAILSPLGEMQVVQLIKSTYTIGRLPGVNDICLLDEEGIVSRVHHCLLERKPEGWWITDNSTNGTTLEREGQLAMLAVQPERRLLLASEDRIRIHTWQIQFVDPNKTRPAKPLISSVVVVEHQLGGCPWLFNVNEQILYRVASGRRERVQIRDKVRVCLNYMVGKNEREGQPTLCGKQELIDAVWPPAENNGTYGDDSLYGLIRDMRQVLEQTKTSCQWLETVKNLGYILRIEVEGKIESS